MGLDISHDAWHGAYSAFMRWRIKVAEVAGFPPLELMEGFYSEENGFHHPFILLDYRYPKGDELDMSALRRIRERLPIKWTLFGNHPLVVLLNHSDCDGIITPGACKRIAEELTKLLPLFPEGEGGGHIGNWKETTQKFIDGCMAAYRAKQPLKFR